jgi:hypothetical protein
MFDGGAWLIGLKHQVFSKPMALTLTTCPEARSRALRQQLYGRCSTPSQREAAYFFTRLRVWQDETDLALQDQETVSRPRYEALSQDLRRNSTGVESYQTLAPGCHRTNVRPPSSMKKQPLWCSRSLLTRLGSTNQSRYAINAKLSAVVLHSLH